MTAPTTTATEPVTRTLEVPGARLSYDIRETGSTSQPPLFLLGSPMGASGFGTLAGYFGDRTVITYDPRGAERSAKSDPSSASTPDEHAEDIHRVIQAVGLGPVELFASSGGAINALTLVARHPEDVTTVVAHEPPAARYVPDAEAAVAACHDIRATYDARGFGAAMAKFIVLVTTPGPVAADFATQQPDPAMFGLPTEDDGTRSDPLVGQNMPSCPAAVLDFDAITTGTTRVVIAAGTESEGTLASRAASGVAERLGLPVTPFPSHHAGFLGGEHGQAGQPEAFAARLREVLAGAD